MVSLWDALRHQESAFWIVNIAHNTVITIDDSRYERELYLSAKFTVRTGRVTYKHFTRIASSSGIILLKWLLLQIYEWNMY